MRTRDALRPLTEGPFGTWVKKLFGKYAGVEVVPKNLRSIFIVWLKDQDDASQRILDASATAMRHHPNTQASLSYDIETNNRQIALANEYASRFASQFQPTASSSAAGGGSSSAAGAADDADDDQELTEGADDEEEAPSATPFAEGEELGDAWHAIYGFGAAPTEAEVRGFLQANPAFLDRVVASESALFIGPVKETLQKVALEMVKGLAAQQGRDTDDEMADAVRASIRSNFIEANMGVMPDELPPLAAQARETLARSNVPLPGEGDTANELSTAAQLAAGAPEQRATSAISELSLTADGTLEPEHEPQPAAAPAAPLRPTKRAAKPPARLELGEGAASRWKTPRVTPASVPAQPQPMANEWSDGGFIAGDQVEAVGRGPSGAREWFKATVNKIRAPTAWPPITVKFTATLDGMTTRLALPEPVTAYVHADDVRRPEA